MQRGLILSAILILIIISVLAGCGGPPKSITYENSGKFVEPVAEFDPDYSMSPTQLYDYLLSSGVYPQGGEVPDSVVDGFLDSLLLDTLLSVEASRHDLQEFWPFYNLARQTYLKALLDAYWVNMIQDSVSVDSADVLQYWADNPDVFFAPEKVRVSFIMSNAVGFTQGLDKAEFDGSVAEASVAAWDRIWMLYEMLKLGAPFDSLASLYTHDVRSRSRGGFLGWAPRGFYEDPFDSVAFDCEPGTFAQPYLNSEGWHLLYISSKVDAGPMPIDSPWVYEQARAKLLLQEQTDLALSKADSLRSVASIVYNDSCLDLATDVIGDDCPLAIISHRDTLFYSQYGGDERAAYTWDEETRTPRQIRMALMDGDITSYSLVNGVRELGLDTLPAIRELRKKIWFRYTKEALADERYQRDKWLPTDSQLQAYFDAHIEEYDPPMPYEVEHLETTDSALANFLLDQARTGVSMEDLQKEWGEQEGYEVTYVPPHRFTKDEVPYYYWRMASSTGTGYANITRVDSLYYVMKVTDRSERVAFPMAKGEISTKLKLQRVRDRYLAHRDKYFNKYNVRKSEPHTPVPITLPELYLRPELYKKLHPDSKQ